MGESEDPEGGFAEADTAVAGGSDTDPTHEERSPSQKHLHGMVKDALFADGPARDPIEPGRVFAGRYRLQELLGQGGMGEVFRARDLVLDEDVAVKFLPPSLAARPGYYDRFVQEVRMARQVSHPAVCRVHDIGEADGRPFISMEYVDGEDLASLLRRIGRLGSEKAIELSHQLCAGLAALHERGIIHRDLKPSNIMLDGEGHIRIADFGLASIADELGEHEIRDGTPAYQAPEQIAGKEVTVRSDVYALGLVLRDMFLGRTGERSRTASSTATADSAVDPQVRLVIDQCLAADPKERPASALAVSAALPGGDPLAAALAAGRLPSPEAVANAGTVGGMSIAWARGVIALTLVALVVLAILNTSGAVVARSPELLAPDVLSHRATQVLERVGHDTELTFESRELTYDEDLIDHLRDGEDRPGETLEQGDASAIRMRYRGFPFDDEVSDVAQDPDEADLSRPGQVEVVVDGRGRLRGMVRIPAEEVASAQEDAPATPDAWAVLLEEAELDPQDLTPVDPTSNPPVYADEVVAWSGVVDGRPQVLHAAALRGQPVWFRVETDRDATEHKHVTGLAGLAVLLMVLTFVAVLVVMLRTAITALRRREGDFVGARRVVFVVLATSATAWLLSAEGTELLLTPKWIIVLAGDAVINWLIYLMLEPYARGYWPRTLVSWNRLLQRRWRDPMVGRDMAVGGVAGTGLSVALPILLEATDTSLFGHHDLDALLGARFALAYFIAAVPLALQITFMLYLALLGLHKVFRNRAVAVVVFVAFIPGFSALVQGTTMEVAGYALAAVVAALVMLRFGLLAMAFCAFATLLGVVVPITMRFGAWHWSTGATSAGLMLALVLLGAWWATAPQRAKAGAG